MNDNVESLATSTATYTYIHHYVTVELTVTYKSFYLISSDKDNQYDYTGVRVWPGADLLCQHLIQQDLHNTSVIELGSGVGLSGLLCSKLSHKNVTLTDCNDAAIELLNKNLDLNDVTHNTNVINLSWSKQNAISALHSTPYDLVIASDIIYPDTTEQTTRDLFDTVDVILGNQSSNGNQFSQCFIVSYFLRSHTTTQLLFDVAVRYQYYCTILMTKDASDTGYVFQFTKQPDIDQSWHTVSPFIDMCHNTVQQLQQDELYAAESTNDMLNTQYQFD